MYTPVKLSPQSKSLYSSNKYLFNEKYDLVLNAGNSFLHFITYVKPNSQMNMLSLYPMPVTAEIEDMQWQIVYYPCL